MYIYSKIYYIINKVLTEKEISRYSRHLLLPEIGTKGQEKLKKAKVLVIGAGGLGCPVLMYLAAAGVGKIGIVDFDTVDETNLQRQVLYDVNDTGKSKAEVSQQKLSRQNPLIEILGINAKLTTQNALELFSNYDIIVDGTDNFSTRYLVNDACVLSGKTHVAGSIFKFQGQVSVFNFKNEKGELGPTYRCLFPAPPDPGSVPSCSEVGVLGVLPGIIGTLMANEVIKVITGTGEILAGKLLLVDSLSLNFHTIDMERNPGATASAPPDAEAFRKMDYDLFCGLRNNSAAIRQISPEELRAILSAKEAVQLLDVRESNEQPEVPELKDLKIPLGRIVKMGSFGETQANLISRDKKVIVICRSGARSTKAIELLSGKFGFQNLYNLKGGVTAWLRAFSEKQKT